MNLVVVRDRLASKPVKAADVTLEGGQIRIQGDTKVLVQLIKSLLSIPTKIKIRTKNQVIKVAPKTSEENLYATLKQNLADPYPLAKPGELIESQDYPAKYEEIVTTNFLWGEDRHELAARKAS